MPVVPLTMKAILFTLADPPGTAVHYECEAAEVVISSEPGDEETYETLCAGGSYVTSLPETQSLSIRGVQDWQAAGLATFLWNAYGQNVDFIYAPYGNATASATQPHFSGVAYINARPQVGGEVGTFAEVDMEYPIQGEVSMLTTGTITLEAHEESATEHTAKARKAS